MLTVSKNATALSFAAMAHYQLGELQPAKQDLDKLTAIIESFDENTPWTQRVPLQVLHAEATKLIRDPTASR